MGIVLLWQGHGMMSSSSVARGRGEFPSPKKWFLEEYFHWGCSVLVLSPPVSHLKPWEHVKLTWTPSCAKKDLASASVAS